MIREALIQMVLVAQMETGPAGVIRCDFPAATQSDEAIAIHIAAHPSLRDRPGLLRDLARALADCGLSVASAHIESRGERAVDVFYVAGPDGDKLTDESQRRQVAERLMDAIEIREAELENLSQKRGLRRAPSSPAR